MKNKLGQVGIAALILSLALVGTIVVAETNETTEATPVPEPAATPLSTPLPEATPAAEATPLQEVTPTPAPSGPEPITTPTTPEAAPSPTATPEATITPTPENNATPQPSTPTPTPLKSEPEIEITYPSKLTRGDAAELKATVTSTGGSEIRIISVSWSLPGGFDVAAKQEDCNILQSGESCSSVVTVKTTTSAALGKNDVKVSVGYD